MAAPAPPAAVDALRAPDPQTWDYVVRAAAHCGQLEAAAVLMRLTREHAHDPELLARTRQGRRLTAAGAAMIGERLEGTELFES